MRMKVNIIARTKNVSFNTLNSLKLTNHFSQNLLKVYHLLHQLRFLKTFLSLMETVNCVCIIQRVLEHYFQLRKKNSY